MKSTTNDPTVFTPGNSNADYEVHLTGQNDANTNKP